MKSFLDEYISNYLSEASSDCLKHNPYFSSHVLTNSQVMGVVPDTSLFNDKVKTNVI